jgi:hypothetical protein
MPKQSRAAHRDCFASAYALRASADSNPSVARKASESGSHAMTQKPAHDRSRNLRFTFCAGRELSG